MLTQKHGIARYVGIQVTIFMSILVFLFAYFLHTVYNWGSDDTVQYFMQVYAEQVNQEITKKQFNLNNKTSAENIVLSNKAFSLYSQLSSLPKEFLDYFPVQEHHHAEVMVYESAGEYVYLLPYFRSDSQDFFYISHIYIETDDVDVGEDDPAAIGITISELTFLLIVLSLLVAYGLALKLAWSFIKPVEKLARWSKSLVEEGNADSESIQSNRQKEPVDQNIPELNFTELKQVAGQIHSSVEALKQKNEKEKQFLRCLSHELRTPLAITKASLELISKTIPDVSEKLNSKLDKIQRANESMCSTTDSLLWLWSANIKLRNQENIQLKELISEAINNNLFLKPKQEIKIENQITEQSVYADRHLLQIVLRNLIRNAFQYTSAGTIEITYANASIIISNPISIDEKNNLLQNQQQNDYGFGVGLYLVESICQQLNWNFKVAYLTNKFIATIDLNSITYT